MRCSQVSPFCAETLSDAELIAVLLKGSPNPATATELRRDGFSLEALTDATGLEEQPWFAEASGKLSVAVELSCRQTWAKVTAGPLLNQRAVIAEYLCLRYARWPQEILGALFLDAENHLIAGEEVFRGTSTRTAVESRLILVRALRHRATNLIIFHNHPSGDPTPSTEDLSFSRRLKKAAATLDMRLLDHMIVAGRRWVSIQARGALR